MNNIIVNDMPQEKPVLNQDHFLGMAGELVQQAEADLRPAGCAQNIFIVVMSAVSVLLAIPTGKVFETMEWSFWLAYGTALLMHVLLVLTTHWTIGFRKTGKTAMTAICGTSVAVLIAAFFFISMARAQTWITGSTMDPFIAYLLSIVIWLVECSVPVSMGGVLAMLTEKTDDRQADVSFWKRHMGLIGSADHDADGAWHDAEAKLKDEIGSFEKQAARYPEKVTYGSNKENKQRSARLKHLYEAHPGKRYAQLNNSLIAPGTPGANGYNAGENNTVPVVGVNANGHSSKPTMHPME